MENCQILDKPKASLSIHHPELVALVSNLVKFSSSAINHIQKVRSKVHPFASEYVDPISDSYFS